MKIAIDVSPLENNNKIRGVGSYLRNLKESLVKYFPEHEYIFFTDERGLKGNLDVVHYPYFDPFFSTLPLRKPYKTVVTVHDLIPLIFPEHFPAGLIGNMRWQLQKFKLRRMDGILVDSQCSKWDVISLAGVNKSKISVAYLAPGEEFKRREKQDIKVKKVLKKYHLPESFTLYVGDVTWNKNVPRIMEAALAAHVPLVMVGKALTDVRFDSVNSWNKDRIKAQLLAAKNNAIIRLGYIPTEDIAALYSVATVFIFPSLYEGFGLPIVEAMSCGCPVLTSKTGSIPEITGDAVYSVDPNSRDDITQGIEKIFNNPKLQRELSIKGLQQAKKFTWKKTAEETMNIYKKVAGFNNER